MGTYTMQNHGMCNNCGEILYAGDVLFTIKGHADSLFCSNCPEVEEELDSTDELTTRK